MGIFLRENGGDIRTAQQLLELEHVETTIVYTSVMARSRPGRFPSSAGPSLDARKAPGSRLCEPGDYVCCVNGIRTGDCGVIPGGLGWVAKPRRVGKSLLLSARRWACHELANGILLHAPRKQGLASMCGGEIDRRTETARHDRHAMHVRSQVLQDRLAIAHRLDVVRPKYSAEP